MSGVVDQVEPAVWKVLVEPFGGGGGNDVVMRAMEDQYGDFKGWNFFPYIGREEVFQPRDQFGVRALWRGSGCSVRMVDVLVEVLEYRIGIAF